MNSRPYLSLLACSLSALLLPACGNSSGGSGGQASTEAAQLRAVLREQGVRPLPPPPEVTDALFRLGQALFFDKILSGNEDVSCATCHLPQFATGDGRSLSDGVGGLGLGPERGGGTVIPRHAPALFAAHLKRALFWDGRVEDLGGFLSVPFAVQLSEEMRATFSPGLEALAAQAMLPPVSREEMRGGPGENPLGDLGDGYGSPEGTPDSTQQVWEELNERLLDVAGYLTLLREAYPGVEVQDFTFAHAANAIAAFEARAFARTDSPFERFVRGDDAALTSEEIAGAMHFFGPAGCSRCHSGSLFTDEGYHNTGLPQLGPGTCPECGPDPMVGPDIGRAHFTGLPEDAFEFRTPSLLNVGLTAPYGHAGQFADLRAFVAHYIDADLANRQYDIVANVSDPLLWPTLVPNSDAVLDTLDEGLREVNVFNVDAVLAFLGALTADDARSLEDVVPESVPSGLPIF
jgi:cytochrome c peroxidase